MATSPSDFETHGDLEIGTRNEVSGVVVGPAVQAGSIHGDLHFHAAARAVGPPVELPASPASFVRREVELATLDSLIVADEARLVVVTGAGGVGKTALVVRWAQTRLAQFGGGQLYEDLGGFSGGDPVDPRLVLTRFLRALGVPATEIPAGLVELATRFRSVTAGRGGMLVVLDNAVSAAQVRVLLPGSAQAVVVVTSRNRLVGLVSDGARLLTVAPLEPVDAVEVLGAVAGRARVAREPAAAHQIVARCGGLPVAVCVAGARLAARPKLSLARLAADLDVDGSLEQVFEASSRALSPSAARLYGALAWHPGRDVGLGPVHALQPALGGDAQAAVDELLAANLLEEIAEDRFRYHDLLRAHARARGPQPEATRLMVEWYLAAALRADGVLTPYRTHLPYRFDPVPARLPLLPQFSDRGAALDWLDAERANLAAAARCALEHGFAELAWQVAYEMWPVFLIRKGDQDQLEVDRLGVTAARAWGNRWAEANMLKRLGRVLCKLGEFTEAEQCTRQAIAGYQQAGDAHSGLDAREGLGAVYWEAGRIAEAAEVYRNVLVGKRVQGDDRRTALTLINLASMLTLLDGTDEAITLLTEADQLLTGLASPDPYNAARARTALARAHLVAGDLAEAERVATEAATRMRHLRSTYETAQATELLGDVARAAGRPEAMAEHWAHAADLYEQLLSARAAPLRTRLAALADSRDSDPALSQSDHDAGRHA